MRSVGGKWKLVGLVSLGEEQQAMKTIIAGHYMPQLYLTFIKPSTNAQSSLLTMQIYFSYKT